MEQRENEGRPAEANGDGGAFAFSVVMAVYNTQGYVREAIESLVGQSIGFENIQLVLVDDGSSDGSGAVCDEYAANYPGNVVCIHQENAGVSAARNAGLEHATGRYVNFLDSDDKWSERAFEQAAAFFAAHPEVNVAAAKYKFFDAKKGNHRLNYKFAEDRVIDLRETYDCPQLHIGSTFIRRAALEGLGFDTELKISEDAQLVNTILLRDLRYGVMREPTYWYRQRAAKDSAIDTMHERLTWYFDTPKRCYVWLFDESERLYGKVLPFVQFTVMYDLQWRLRAGAPRILDRAQTARYRELLCGLLRRIDDYIISEQRTISIDYVAYALCLKYRVTMDDLLAGLYVEDGMVRSRFGGHDVPLRPLERLSDKLTVDMMEYAHGRLILEGYLNSFRFPPDDLRLVFYANNRPHAVPTFVTDRPLRIPFDDKIPGKTGFRFGIDIPRNAISVIRAEVSLLGGEPVRLVYRAGEQAHLADDAPGEDEWREEDATVRLALSGTLSITRE